MSQSPVVVIGAGIGGLCAAIDLAARGVDVLVIERTSGPGGKLRPVTIAGQQLDAGPTVFTMKWVFDQLFAEAGASFDGEVATAPLDLLARHAWPDGSRLDLHADVERSADAIGQLAGAADARGFLAFCERARKIYATLEVPFIRSEQPSPVSLARGAGLGGLGDLWRISPFTTMWRALGEHFRDQRLRQLFGRYATYNGSSPFIAPATLMLIAHVEQAGVWSIDGGMHTLASKLEALATRLGARFRYGAAGARVVVEAGRAAAVVLDDGERIPCAAIIFNGDAAAVGAGLIGPEVQQGVPSIPASTRSLSAVTFSFLGSARGFPLSRHNVFFGPDYAREFDDIFVRARLPLAPTVYLCAQDRDAEGAHEDTSEAQAAERFLCLVNAPAIGDRHAFTATEIEQCRRTTFEAMHRAGLNLEPQHETMVIRTPQSFEQSYPATGGALYGQAAHGWRASFSRPATQTRIKGLYLAGGSVHPGAGVPMAALSGRIAARRLLADQTSRRRS
ncbi:MAG: phytoene desaturase [Hyphomicrobiaceae bacterium]|nr:phytoene desaturase [Hyphomicrobiaceae bacterium]